MTLTLLIGNNAMMVLSIVVVFAFIGFTVFAILTYFWALFIWDWSKLMQDYRDPSKVIIGSGPFSLDSVDRYYPKPYRRFYRWMYKYAFLVIVILAVAFSLAIGGTWVGLQVLLDNIVVVN